jgi:hypothetical protein
LVEQAVSFIGSGWGSPLGPFVWGEGVDANEVGSEELIFPGEVADPVLLAKGRIWYPILGQDFAIEAGGSRGDCLPNSPQSHYPDLLPADTIGDCQLPPAFPYPTIPGGILPATVSRSANIKSAVALMFSG